MPSEGFVSVSIVCPSSAQGDALSTALFCMTVEEGQALIESLPDTEAMWVLADGTKITTSGFDRFTVQP
jgi:thiamine biosynthesis lipoprotein